MNEQPKASTSEVKLPKPLPEATMRVIGYISISRAERLLDDRHEVELMRELMSQ